MPTSPTGPTQAPTPTKAITRLPFSRRPLIKEELPTYRRLFGYYLSVQKGIEMPDLDEREIKGRWKSFMRKWNRGELAEGWYDHDTYLKAHEMTWYDKGAHPKVRKTASTTQDTSSGIKSENSGGEGPADDGTSGHVRGSGGQDDEDDDGDGYGPSLPSAAGQMKRSGAAVPSLQDLSMRKEQDDEDRLGRVEELREARKLDRKEQKERLDELVPRADAGTRERKLEKKAAVNDKMREFREKSPGMEANEQDLMGGGDSVEELKKLKSADQKRKTERELWREETRRARMAEREERLKGLKEREEGTIKMLRELAKERFG
jgi:hypothetical protein